MLETTEKGRRRHKAILDLLGMYPAATTNQIADLIYLGDRRNARRHLKKLTETGVLRRVPHPYLIRGPLVYTRTQRQSAHSQKILHALQVLDLHVAIAQRLAHLGARAVYEMPWAPFLIPDLTVFLGRSVVGIELHLSGRFQHGEDYRRFVEEEAYTLCHWWKTGVRLELLGLAASPQQETVRADLRRHHTPGFRWTVTTVEAFIQEPGRYLKS